MIETNNTKGAVLLIDDLPENLQLLSDLLIKLGYNVRCVTSGKMALKTLKVKQPDVILLDIKMPEMDGYQVCQAIKSDPTLKDIPIIFISALDDTFDKLKAFQSGGVDYITKPFQIEEVVARVESQLIIKRQKNHLQEEIKKRQQAEDIIRQSRAFLSSILNTSLDGIAALQAVREPKTGKIEDFRCLVVNPIMGKFFNLDHENVVGKLIFKRLISKLNPNLFNGLVQVVETGKILEEELYYKDDKKSVWYHFVAVKLGDGFAITVRDMTDRKTIELKLQQANHKLQLIANLDSLTQISNRRRFDDCLKREWQRHLREQQFLGLILIDIDYFKRYNDYYGLQGGDDCLIKVAQTIAKIPKRSTDLVARYGGEEFAVILPNTTPEGALIVAEQIKEAIAILKLPHAQSEVSQYVTISLGIASLIPNQNLKLEDLINQADLALYTAKNQGRDRAVLLN